MSTCALFGAACADTALYRAWLDGPCGLTGGACPGHPVCAEHAVALRGGRLLRLKLVRLADLVAVAS